MNSTFQLLAKKINLSELISKDWLLKIISLVLAAGLWYYVGGEDRVDKNVMIPIEIINLPRDLVISNQFKKEIEVTVSGPRSVILEMTSRAITRQVDLSSATPGTMVIENDNDHIPVPRGITVQRVQPSSIILSLDKLIQKQFPISAKTAGEVLPGYYIKTIKMDPDVITITGPRTILSQFDEFYTQAINLTGVRQSTKLQVPLDLTPAFVELIGETSVTASLSVELETVTKTLDEMPVHAMIDGVRRKVMPESVKVTAKIPKKLLADSVDPKNLLTVTTLQEGNDNNLRLQVMPHADVELPIDILSIIPAVVRLVDANVSPLQEEPEKDSSAAGADQERKTLDLATGETAQAVVRDDAVSIIKVIKKQKIKRKLTD